MILSCQSTNLHSTLAREYGDGRGENILARQTQCNLKYQKQNSERVELEWVTTTMTEPQQWPQQ